MKTLADTTVLILARRDERVRTWLTTAAIRNDIALCDQVVLEYLRGARNASEFEVFEEVLAAFPLLRVEPQDWDRARTLYRSIARVSGGYQQSVPIADALVAAVAQRNDVMLVHYDEDFDRIASVTGQAHQWVVPRGSA